MHQPHPLKFLEFELQCSVLSDIKNTPQGKYLINYLRGLGAKQILIEPNYFDRDYLSEFSVFYSTSVYGYKNICQRVHFFSNKDINRKLFKKAVGGDAENIKILNDSYLGFCVLRPIQAQLGRTVLKWYDNRDSHSKRITVKRKYKCHVAGVELEVEGLAWQQQDTGVGACATIALWSSLHSSAFDDFHAIPTTAEITKLAHKTASLGSRTFPSKGLTSFQLNEAIKELGLSPMIQHGDLDDQVYFTKERFMNSIASYIRSDYPVIILGHLFRGDSYVGEHAVCAVGFREATVSSRQSNSQRSIITLEDFAGEILYINDDNIGPNARFKIEVQKHEKIDYSVLHLAPPEHSKFKETNGYQIIPTTLVVAVHNELRASPDQLHKVGVLNVAFPFSQIFKNSSIRLSLSTRFIKLTDYIHNELGRLLKDNPNNLSQLRLGLWEKVRPMSLHLGLVRIGMTELSVPLLDVLYDTTDSNLQVFDYIHFNSEIDKIIKDFELDFNSVI